jgi:hypothetical protein
MPQRRRRFRQTTSLQDRLEAWSKTLRERAEKLPPGPTRDELLKKLRQAHTAAHIDDWANPPGIQGQPDRMHGRREADT